MKNNKLVIFISAALLAVISITTLLSFETKSPMLTYNNDNYEQLWKEVDSLDRLRQPKSALEKVKVIYDKAKTDNNPSQFIKAVIYKGKYETQLEEDGLVNTIYRMETEIEEAAFPMKPILQSMLAEMYNNYLNQNRWKFRNRSATNEWKQEDIRTWDIEKLTTESIRLYNESVEDDRLKQVKLSEIAAITTTSKGTKHLRPTLYDFLIHRTFDFFANSQTHLTKPKEQFYVETPDAFAPAKDFVKVDFETKDSFALKYYNVKRLQEAIEFHLKDEDPAALIDVDLKRLEFVYNNSILLDKEEQYLKALEALSKKYANNAASTEITHKVARLYYKNGQKYKPSPTDTYKWDLKKAYNLCATAIEKFPESYGAEQCKSLQTTILQKQLQSGAERVNTPNEPILSWITYKNIDKVHIKVVKVSDNAQTKISNMYGNELVNYLNSLNNIKQWSLDLPNDGDYQTHTTEFSIDKLPAGKYGVLIANNEKFSNDGGAVSYFMTNVSNLSYFVKNTKGASTKFYVVDRETGKPLEGVKAEWYTRKYNRGAQRYDYKKKGILTTNKDGFVKITQNDYYRVKFSKGSDYLFLEESFSNRRYRDNRRVQQMTHFFLDRGIYRPGQTIYFKGLALQKDKESMPSILANKQVMVTLLDVNYQKVASLNLTTNEYGTFKGEFQAPQGGLTGRMTLRSSIGNGSHSFRVEEYKRPKFEVKFSPIKESFALGETAKIEGFAKAYAGNNIDGAKVQYRVIRQVTFPYWRWWRWGWYNPFRRDDTEITNGETTSDEEGKYTIEFEALPDKSIPKERRPQFTYKVIADVTDITGETHSNTTYVNVGYIAMNADIEVPNQLDREKIKNFAIKTTNLNGQFEAAKGDITIQRLVAPKTIYKKRYWTKPDKPLMSKADFKNKFSTLPYANENEVQNWEKGQTVLKSKFDTEKEKTLDISKAAKWVTGKYLLTLKTKDKNGEPIELIKYFTLFDKDAKRVPTNEVDWFVQAKNTYEPGETAKFTMGSAAKKNYVLFEVEHKGSITKSEWVEFKNLQTFKIPIEEKHRGGVHYHLTFVHDNRSYVKSKTIQVPWSNKDLKIEYATFRNKLLPGQQEEWQLKISGANKDKVAAEFVAAMYDASLDAFASNSWTTSFYPSSYPQRTTRAGDNFRQINGNLIANRWQPNYHIAQSRNYPILNWFGFSFYEYERYNTPVMVGASRPRPKMSRRRAKSESAPMPTSAAPMEGESEMVVSDEVAVPATYSTSDVARQEAKEEVVDKETAKEENFDDVKVRTNLNETVFFMPNLRTDAEGNVIIKFTMNEALTKWKFLGFGHTKDLKYGFTENEVVTQKDLMIVPNAPRFFRENDEIYFTAKVSNLSEGDLEGSAVLQVFDALTMKPIDVQLGNRDRIKSFTAKQGQSAPLSWKLKLPDSGVSAVTYRVQAKAGDFSDGEESAIPVLTNRMMVIETLPLAVRGGQSKDFKFAALGKAGQSSSLKHHQMTLEFTSNPAWYAVQSLPYLMEYPYECTEQLFNRYYANSLATSVANSHPKIKQVFDTWKNLEPEALASNLSKNEELKYALLEETPWVLQAQNEELQKKNIGLLFDLNRMSKELQRAMRKLNDRQQGSGGFAWFPGGRESWYITQYVVEGMGHLEKLGVNSKVEGLQSTAKMGDMLQQAIVFIDNEMLKEYKRLAARVAEGKTTWDKDHLGYMQMHYLYTRSFYLKQSMTDETKKAFEYYLGQAKKYWTKKAFYMQGMLALAMTRTGETAVPALIVKSFKERSLNDDERGMYWKYNPGYYWYQLPIETHALMIEVFDEVANDAQAVDDLKVWLLKSRQTTHWKTTKATSAAVYAMLLRGDNWLMEDQEVTIKLGGETLDQSKIKKEAGTGHFKVKWEADEITSKMANVSIQNPNKNPAWGSMYWQYFEDLDKIKTFEDTPLKLKKKLFKETLTDRGTALEPITENNKLTPGDKVIVRIELRVDRPMEYVHMKDARASGFEPINVLSQYKWQGGLGYYESTRDAATNFFISFLPKGSYVFEYPLRVNHKGDFSNGVTTIQCMYAPEFTSHSEGIRVTVE